MPSPYSIKMALLNQAITVGGELAELDKKNSAFFSYIKDAKISYFIENNSFFAVSNSFVKILKPSHNGTGFGQTVAFREYFHLSNQVEIIFEVETIDQKEYLQNYLYRINYFGKRGCFFQFLEFSDSPNEPNVLPFDSKEVIVGILQEYDDFDEKVNFENVNNFSSKPTKRKKDIFVLPLQQVSSSKSFTVYKSF